MTSPRAAQTGICALRSNTCAALLLRRFSTEAGSSKVVSPKSGEEYTEAVQRAGSKTVSYFTAAWCGPCRAIGPLIDKVSNEMEQISFLKLDIDDENLLDIARDNEIVSVPTFIFRKETQILHKCVGADQEQILQGLQKLIA